MTRNIRQDHSGKVPFDSGFVPADGDDPSLGQATQVVHCSEVALSFGANGLLDPESFKSSCREFYNAVTVQLNAGMFGEFAYFLNYGYQSDDSPQDAVIILPKQCLNRNCIKLILELVGDCSLQGLHILDVGCGRGGTVSVLAEYFTPASVAGIDLSSAAIAFCRQTHKAPNLSFYEGDAERLIFPDSSFDVVTNIESSHSYPDIEKFYTEVLRVLRPGGRLLYTDMLTVDRLTRSRAYLKSIGFETECERDITNNVLLSCNEVAAFRTDAFNSANDIQTMHDFLGTPGSETYEAMRSGAARYVIWRLRKRS